MRVVFKKAITERINEAKDEALLAGRSIEKIVLTKEEMDELARRVDLQWLVPLATTPGGLRWITPPPKVERITQFLGIRIEQE